MDSSDTYWHDRALLEWQVELGVTDAILDAPVDRYALEAAKPAATPATKSKAAEKANTRPPIPQAVDVDGVAIARAAAGAAADLTALSAAMQAFDHCELKRGARDSHAA